MNRTKISTKHEFLGNIRRRALLSLYNHANRAFPLTSRGYKNKFLPGSWLVSDNAQWRFDICRVCGCAYANRRQRGVHYKIHHWWHYCSKGICSACSNSDLMTCYTAYSVMEAVSQEQKTKVFDKSLCEIIKPKKRRRTEEKNEKLFN